MGEASPLYILLLVSLPLVLLLLLLLLLLFHRLGGCEHEGDEDGNSAPGPHRRHPLLPGDPLPLCVMRVRRHYLINTSDQGKTSPRVPPSLPPSLPRSIP